MDNDERRRELGDFLRNRRARLTPTEMGLAAGSRRRTPGLRREEVAQLADIGLTWYTWLEQGREIGVSAQALERLSKALRLDTSERTHLFLLARQGAPVNAAPVDESVPDGLHLLLEHMQGCPAWVLGKHWDVLAWNAEAEHIFGDWTQREGRDRNFVWYLFNNPEARRLFPEWEETSQRIMAQFRADTGALLGDPPLAELLDCLKTVSPEFASWWTRHDICGKLLARVRIVHPERGIQDYETATLHLGADPHRKIIAFAPHRQ
jgi:transcriptional regulator with XRE-family HTH domain